MINIKEGNNISKKRLILTLRLTQSNQWAGVEHASRIHLLNSTPATSSVDKIK